MTEPVRLVQQEEAARFDPSRLEQLCRDKGEHKAESEAADALDRINTLLRDIGSHRSPRSRAELGSLIDDLIAAAEMIGMATLSRVARNVRDCLSRSDPVALSATLSRLDRVGERSIHALFDLENVTL